MTAPRGVIAAIATATVTLASPASSAAPGRVTFVVHAPAGTPADATLHVSGDRAELGEWNGVGIALARSSGDSARVWSGSLALPAGTAFEFKVTRGSWETVEKDAGGAERGNRRWTVAGPADTVRIDVATWRDASPGAGAPRAHTITGRLERFPDFRSKFVAARELLVWLPPGYAADSTRRYPVVYLHDGQNVFDGATSFIPGQEWQADEVADLGIRSGRLPACILVGIPNTPARMDEYTFARDARHGGGRSADYMRFLLDEVKPFVDRTFRTRPDARHTAVVGSSLGGLVSLDLGLLHPGTFGAVGCVSPAAWWADRDIVTRLTASRTHLPVRIWIDIGTAESTPTATGSEPWVDDARAMRDALRARGWVEGADLHYEEVEGAKHNEAAWAARIGRILQFVVPRD